MKLAKILLKSLDLKSKVAVNYVVNGFAIRKKKYIVRFTKPFLKEKFPSFDEHVGILKSQKNSSNFQI